MLFCYVCIICAVLYHCMIFHDFYSLLTYNIFRDSLSNKCNKFDTCEDVHQSVLFIHVGQYHGSSSFGTSSIVRLTHER